MSKTQILTLTEREFEILANFASLGITFSRGKLMTAISVRASIEGLNTTAEEWNAIEAKLSAMATEFGLLSIPVEGSRDNYGRQN